MTLHGDAAARRGTDPLGPSALWTFDILLILIGRPLTIDSYLFLCPCGKLSNAEPVVVILGGLAVVRGSRVHDNVDGRRTGSEFVV